MCRLFPLLAVLPLLVPQSAAAWGPEGHIMVARIAELNLSDKAKEQIKKLLEEKSIADSRNANWADYIKKSAAYRDKYPNNGTYHYVDIPVDTSKYEPEKQCKDGTCIIDRIEAFRKVLADPKAEDLDRKEALLFLVHLVGDLHQPLHCAERNADRGGNSYSVRYLGDRGKDLNLHKVWDMNLVRDILDDLEPLDKAQRLNHGIKAEDRKTWEKGKAQDWAMEAHQVAKDVVYKDVPEDKGNEKPPFNLDENYVKRGKPVVEDQIKKAGIRLAKVLNDCLDK